MDHGAEVPSRKFKTPRVYDHITRGNPSSSRASNVVLVMSRSTLSLKNTWWPVTTTGNIPRFRVTAGGFEVVGARRATRKLAGRAHFSRFHVAENNTAIKLTLGPQFLQSFSALLTVECVGGMADGLNSRRWRRTWGPTRQPFSGKPEPENLIRAPGLTVEERKRRKAKRSHS